jgi:hypothetical protein
MSLNYYVALSFVKAEGGVAPGQAMECQSETQALMNTQPVSNLKT